MANGFFQPIPAIQKLASRLANRIDSPTGDYGEGEAKVRGFLAGGLQGAVDANSSPLDLLLNLVPAGKLAGALKYAGLALPAGKKLFRGVKEGAELAKPGIDRLIHFAENLPYAAAHARKSGGAGNVYEAELDVLNALDLTPRKLGRRANGMQTAEDIERLMAEVPDEMQGDLGKALEGWRGSSYPDELASSRMDATSLLVDHLLRTNPNALTNAGFDGIKYYDGIGDDVLSWAVPNAGAVKNARRVQ